MERDSWSTIARDFAGLEPAEQVGRKAAARALRRLNPVKVSTRKAPVIFDQRMAGSLLKDLFDAVHGMTVYRQESFLAGKLGQRVAAENLTLIDDGPRRYSGRRPATARRTDAVVLVSERGMLQL
jgi:PmbA protein